MLLKNVLSSFVPRSWIGELKLYFGLRDYKSVLLKRWHRGPFLVQRPFYYDDEIPHVYLLHPPGGLIEGDQLNLEVNLDNNSQVLFTMPGATKFYRSGGMYVFIKQKFNLSEGSILEWLPQCNILFSESKVIMESELYVKKGARFIFFETLCFYSSQYEGADIGGTLNMFVSIVLENAIGLRERLKIDHSDQSIINKLSGYKINGILYALPSNIQVLHDVRVLIDKHNVMAGGATLLNNLLIVRLLDNKNERVETLLRDLWCFLRPSIVGKQGVFPRVWFT